MEQKTLFVPLGAPQSRWKSFLIGWGIQINIVAAILLLNIIFPKQVERLRKYAVTALVAPVEPVIAEAQPRNARLHVRIRPDSALTTVQTITTPKLVVPLPAHSVKRPEPEVKAPEISVEARVPNLPRVSNALPTNVVATNTFSQPNNTVPTTTRPAAQVQTGGFGDPNGVRAKGDKEHAVNIASQGNFGLPAGSGFGNGLGASKGSPGVGIVGNGVVQSSGFDSRPIAPTRRVEVTVTASSSVPEIISKPRPNYTEEGRRAKVEGEVRLEVLFATTGKAHVVKVLQGLGYGLDEQAVRAAEQIKFKPAQHDGEPIDSTFVVHIIFELAS